jgi:MYXO-CTERM domain-containing protein
MTSTSTLRASLPALGLAALATLVTHLWPRPAGACSLVGNDDHQLDAAYANDTVAPSMVTAAAIVHRSADDVGCAGASSCGDIASIAVSVAATDNAAPIDKLGYQVRVVDGDVPAGLNIPVQPVTTYGGDDLYFYFNYGDRTGFVFDLEIRARDLNGNLGPPTVITVGEPGEGGCSTGSGDKLPALAGVLVALALVLRRRR